MASQPPQPTRRATSQQQVYKPRASLVKFNQYYPLVLTGVAALVAVGIAIGYFAHMWLVSVMMVFPLFSTVVGATAANRLSKSCVVIDQAGMRLLKGDTVQDQVPWNQVTRLTVREERGDNVYEVWIQSRPVTVPASYYENGEQLLATVSARTNRPWERQREPQAATRGRR